MLVQALHWFKDELSDNDERLLALGKLRTILAHEPKVRADLSQGFSALPIWMQAIVRDLLRDVTAALTDAR